MHFQVFSVFPIQAPLLARDRRDALRHAARGEPGPAQGQDYGGLREPGIQRPQEDRGLARRRVRGRGGHLRGALIAGKKKEGEGKEDGRTRFQRRFFN